MEETKVDSSLFMVEEELRALTMLEAEITEMHFELVRFKKNNPENPKIETQEKRLNRMYQYADIINYNMMASSSYKGEISRLRWSLAHQTTVLKDAEKEIEELTEKIETLKRQIAF